MCLSNNTQQPSYDFCSCSHETSSRSTRHPASNQWPAEQLLPPHNQGKMSWHSPDHSLQQSTRTHHIVGVIQKDYKTDNNWVAFPVPAHLRLWDKTISLTASIIKIKIADTSHKAKAKDYYIWNAAEDGSNMLICAAIDDVYIAKLKDGITYFHKVITSDVLEHMDQN